MPTITIPRRWLLLLTLVPSVVALACASAQDQVAEEAQSSNIPVQSVPASRPDISSTSQPPKAAPLNAVVLAQVDFIHDSFRAQVTGSQETSGDPGQSSGRTLQIGLRNLSQPSSGLNTRATINFSREFDNYVDVPTTSGPLRLYLHRDGTLRPEPDRGSFT